LEWTLKIDIEFAVLISQDHDRSGHLKT